MKDLFKILLSGVCGAIFAVAAMLFLAHHYHTTPVALINSNTKFAVGMEMIE